VFVVDQLEGAEGNQRQVVGVEEARRLLPIVDVDRPSIFVP